MDRKIQIMKMREYKAGFTKMQRFGLLALNVILLKISKHNSELLLGGD